MKYYIEKTLKTDFESAVQKATEALKKEGFGVLSEINIDEKLKEKLGVDYPKYRILGACNPPLAYEALKKENKIGTMLPCNVIVREISGHETEVAAVDPVASMQAVENPELGGVASDVQARLKRVIASL
ncbi:MAG TPA: DUF302 domain-containing protein [Prolixibacteraceae bacterium]|nr:DUF302 domain-containing protein [Prolixibacteraceae bacterium]